MHEVELVLLPCPFCGSTKVELTNWNFGTFSWVVRCLNCFSQGTQPEVRYSDIGDAERDGADVYKEKFAAMSNRLRAIAIAKWNTRAVLPVAYFVEEPRA